MCEALNKMREEAAAKATELKENEDIKITYELMQEVAPDLDKKTKVKLIAKKFKKTIKYVNSMIFPRRTTPDLLDQTWVSG